MWAMWLTIFPTAYGVVCQSAWGKFVAGHGRRLGEACHVADGLRSSDGVIVITAFMVSEVRRVAGVLGRGW